MKDKNEGHFHRKPAFSIQLEVESSIVSVRTASCLRGSPSDDEMLRWKGELLDEAFMLELGQLPSIRVVVELAARFESLVRDMHLRDMDEIGIMFTAPGLPLLLKWA